MRRNLVVCAVGLFGLTVSPSAHATLIAPGECVGPVVLGCVAPLSSNGSGFNGTLVASTGDLWKNIGGNNWASSATGQLNVPAFNAIGKQTFSIQFQSEVYLDSVTGGLDFYYQFANSTTTPPTAANCISGAAKKGCEAITQESISEFRQLTQADVGFNSTAGMLPGGNGTGPLPVQIDWSPDGSTFTANFTPGAANNVWNGITTETLLIKTDFTAYTIGADSFQGTNSSTVQFQAFEPLATVPEPVSIVLLGTTLALAALFIRRRHVAQASKAETRA
jgi:hypothetical protein